MRLISVETEAIPITANIEKRGRFCIQRVNSGEIPKKENDKSNTINGMKEEMNELKKTIIQLEGNNIEMLRKIQEIKNIVMQLV